MSLTQFAVLLLLLTQVYKFKHKKKHKRIHIFPQIVVGEGREWNLL